MTGIRMAGRSTSEISFEITHELSGATIATMAPKDNGGDGSCFSPTDLCAASLGACASTVMGLYARSKGFAFKVSFEVVKTMQTIPRRIAALELNYQIEAKCTDLQFRALQEVAKACPVRQSLHPDIVVTENFTLIAL